MSAERKKTILILCSGLMLGGMAGYFRAKMSFHRAVGEAESTVFHERAFAQASSIDSAIMLAQQLPLADAQKCAALAQAMLTKRVRMLVMVDPFDTDSWERFEDRMLPKSAWEGLFKRWFQMAPEAAWVFALANHRDNELPLREAALHQWALLDPLAAVKSAGDAITKEERQVILNACIENHPAKGLQLLLEWGVENVDKFYGDPFASDQLYTHNLLNKLAENSPLEALEWCKAHKPDELDAVCVGWARHDLEDCLGWIATQEIAEQKDLLAHLCKQEDVSLKTVRVLASLCEPAEVLDWVGKAFDQIAKRDEAMAQALIDELLPNPTDRMLARCSMAEEIVQTDPRKAMALLLPSLRRALPLYQQPTSDDVTNGASSGFNGSADYYVMAGIFEEYLELGPAAGVGKAEALALLKEIHPQYHSFFFGHNRNALWKILGSPSEWAFPFLRDMPRKEMSETVKSLFGYASADMAWRDMESLAPGILRDVMSEYCLGLMIDHDAPVDSLLAAALEHGGTQLDLSRVYESWMSTAPDEALRHLQANPDAKDSEWEAVIVTGYKMHAEEIQNAVLRMPAGALRQAAVAKLAYSASYRGGDVISAVYWATEITDPQKRYKQMRQIWKHWQDDEDLRYDPEISDAVRQNVERSILDAQEKSLWLERLESEVPR